jgi:hypothetical protein
MKNHVLRTAAFGLTLTAAAFAQNQRQATMVGGGAPDRGKCTVEVVVDITAQVEIRGNSANLKTLAGQPSQWRRFECTGPLPANPANFRFAGVDGRGRQDLIRDPRQGGVAVVQIEDKQGGSEGYTFDIFWDSGRGNGPVTNIQPPDNRDQRGPDYRDQRGPDQARGGGFDNNRGDNRDNQNRDERYRDNYRNSDYYRRYGHGFGVDEAVRVCQQNILDQATRRFNSRDIHFNRTAVEDNPGRQDWVSGTLDVPRGQRGEDRYHFSCSVDFDSGRVRTVQLDDRPMNDRR